MKKTHLIALILLAVGTGAIVISAAKNDTFSDYKCFGETEQVGDEKYQVVGTWVKEEGIEYDPATNPNHFGFYVKDKCGEKRKVVYHDIKPQGFERSEQVVITGHLDGEIFDASKILIKCPSKYIEDEVKLREHTEPGL